MARKVKCRACGARNARDNELCRICASNLSPDRELPLPARAHAKRRSSPVFSGLLLVALIGAGAFVWIQRQEDDAPDIDPEKMAEEALPRPGDFPRGFTEASREVGEDYEELGCTEMDDLYEDKLSAIATNEMTRGDSVVSTEVSILESAQDARELINVLNAVSTRECLELLIAQELGLSVELDPDATPGIGDRAGAYRGSVIIRGIQVPFDVVQVQQGRAVVVAFSIAGPDNPITSRQVAEVLIQVLGRLDDLT